MQREKKEEKINAKLLILLIVVIIIFIILHVMNSNKEKSYENYKLDSKKEYVYTKYHSDTNKAIVPFINITGIDAEIVNDEVLYLSKNYLTSTDKNKTVTYRYNQNKNILSLVMTFRDIDSNGQLNYSYKTYVFDLSKNGDLLTNEEILKKFNMSYQEVNEKMASIMKEKYKEEVKKGIIDQTECNYSCYIGLRKITNYIDNANYYIENSHLVVYRAFNAYSIYKEENYFTRDDFKFLIK